MREEAVSKVVRKIIQFVLRKGRICGQKSLQNQDCNPEEKPNYESLKKLSFKSSQPAGANLVKAEKKVSLVSCHFSFPPRQEDEEANVKFTHLV